MAPVNIDIMNRFFGSSNDPFSESEKTHKSAIDANIQKDLNESLKTVAERVKKLTDLQTEYQQSTGINKQELEQFSRSIRSRSMEEVQGLLESSGFSTHQAGRGAKTLISSIERQPDREINEVLEEFSEKMGKLKNRAKETSDGFNNLITALGGGFGGGMFASGMIAGNPITMAQGALVAGASIWQAEGIGKKLQASALAGGAALAQFGDEAIRIAPEASSRAMQIQRELIRGGSGVSLESFFDMGRGGPTGIHDVLSTEQKLQFSQLFSQTGGGSTQQLQAAMDQFAKYTLVYGDSAMAMMQAARKLDMWVPQGNFSREMSAMTNELKARGFAPEQIQEQIQALTPLIVRQSQTGRSVEEMETSIRTTGQLAVGLGMGGGQAVQAVQGYQSMFKSALQNPSMYAFLTEKAKISRSRALAIANGATPDSSELQQIADSLKDAYREFGGGTEANELRRYAISQLTGGNDAMTEQISRSMGISRGITGARAGAVSETGLINKIITQQSDTMLTETTRIIKEQHRILTGLSEDMNKLARYTYLLQEAADKIAVATGSGMVKVGEAPGNFLKGAMTMGGKALNVVVVGAKNASANLPNKGKK